MTFDVLHEQPPGWDDNYNHGNADTRAGWKGNELFGSQNLDLEDIAKDLPNAGYSHAGPTLSDISFGPGLDTAGDEAATGIPLSEEEHRASLLGLPGFEF